MMRFMSPVRMSREKLLALLTEEQCVALERVKQGMTPYPDAEDSQEYDAGRSRSTLGRVKEAQS